MNTSSLINRTVILSSGRTSLRFEQEFWDALAAIAEKEGTEVNKLIDRVTYDVGSRTSAVRVFVLNWFRSRMAA